MAVAATTGGADGKSSIEDAAQGRRDAIEVADVGKEVKGGSDSKSFAGRRKSSASDPSRRVSFQEHPHAGESQANMASERRDRSSVPDDHDSSADERTGILASARDSRGYQTAAASSSAGAQTTGAAMQANEDSRAGPGTLKKRKSKTSGQNQNGEVEETNSWWAALLEKYGSVELENKGSVARDHLALERTFLAWLRTSLSFASIGIAITQLFRLNTSLQSSDPNTPPSSGVDGSQLHHVGKPLGATFIAIAVLILFIGFHRYFEAQHYVVRGKFPASRGSIFIVSVVGGALIVVSLVVILTLARGSFD